VDFRGFAVSALVAATRYIGAYGLTRAAAADVASALHVAALPLHQGLGMWLVGAGRSVTVG
jgi:hypothetical protein